MKKLHEVLIKLFTFKKKINPVSYKKAFDGKFTRKGRVKVEITSFSKPKNGNWTFTGYRITENDYTTFTIERPSGTNVKQAKQYVLDDYKLKKQVKK
jgi:hypothetical protein